MLQRFFISSLFFLLTSCFSLFAQTEYAAGLAVDFGLSGEYQKTGTGFEFKSIGYYSDVSNIRIGAGYLSYPKTTKSLLATAVDASFSDPDSIFVDNKINRQQYRVDLQYGRILTGSSGDDRNLYAFGGLRLSGYNQRYRPESYSDDLYQIAGNQSINGFELFTRGTLGVGYEIALDFFDFIYFEVETSTNLFSIRQIDGLSNSNWSVGLNFGFRTNFSN